MANFVDRAGLSIAPELVSFVEDELLDGLSIGTDTFWSGFASLVGTYTDETRGFLRTRTEMQNRIDDWYKSEGKDALDPAAQERFLREIGYLVDEGESFTVDTANVDPEIASMPGPQLVVPMTNARYVLNAANARWGSLYDAVYGTDVLGSMPPAGGYDADRGAEVTAWARDFLDRTAPLAGTSWREITGVTGEEGRLTATTSGGTSLLMDPEQYVGIVPGDGRREIILRRNGLHLRIVVDPTSRIGRADTAGISDVILEAAVSTIADCEDSVACVDAEDKVLAYRNWLGLMRGDLETTVSKGDDSFVRSLSDDVTYRGPDGRTGELKGRSLLLCRNVGFVMTTPAVRDGDGNEVFEHLLDAWITVTAAMHDLAKTDGPRNSAAGSVYIVKPKMHGPAEVDMACRIFDAVEDHLGLDRHTVKIGVMDEERRTSANLGECIRAARHRVAFINTGFLDRTGDEIHTAMEAGPMIPKGEMKATAWIEAYEARNVDIGLACGLKGRGQIGKGMWSKPAAMAAMLTEKGGHPMAGATTAWVPSPTAATLHATHYHETDVLARQDALAAGGPRGSLADLLTVPAARGRNFSDDEVTAEMENNAQGILGYVVRWVDQGVGCSTVPDINDIGLMEDRATCRISSQALANWLHHGVVGSDAMEDTLRRMAEKVDAQNEGDPNYAPMAPDFDGPAFRAARALVFEGREQPSGYTEPVLHAYRQEAKAS